MLRNEFFSNDSRWLKEANIWATFYMEFNDDNAKHMDQSFFNMGGFYMSAEELHTKNIEWVNNIGLDDFYKYNSTPELEAYAEEYKETKELDERE